MNTTLIQRIWIILALLAVSGGMYFFYDAAGYLYAYYAEPDNPYRHEYQEGVMICMFLSMPFWVAASGFMFLIKEIVPKYILLTTNIISGALCGIFIGCLILMVILMVASQWST